jgi:dTDP-L-rhamnose 4-epimerase
VRVLVTGGAGFIGSHVVDELIGLGMEVRVADVLLSAAHSRVPDYLNPAADFVQIDVCDETDMRAMVSDVDAVCHQASMVGLGVSFSDVCEYVRNNDLGTAVLLKSLDAVGFRGRLILASSMVVYGEGTYSCSEHGEVRPGARRSKDLDAGRFEPPCPVCARELRAHAITEHDATDPRNVYAATKLHQEHLCLAYGRESGTAVAALRYHNVYGPRMPRDTPYAGVASIFRSALERGQAPEAFEDGQQIRDFVHVRDVARANAMCLTSDEPLRGTFNVASGEARTVRDMAEALAATFGPEAPGPTISGRYRLGDVRHIFASPARARESFGFAAVVPFDVGMKEFAISPLR